VSTPFLLRPYCAADEDAAIALWQRTWQMAYPAIDFTARVDWWRTRWRDELVPATQIVVAETGDALTGFVTVDPKTHYLDQLVVAPEEWGSPLGAALMDAAKALSPDGLEILVNADNARAIRFYEKQGFAVTAHESNPRSGAPVLRMAWGSLAAD
jgi:putative acetyltransferase